jgi:hypothetical protein
MAVYVDSAIWSWAGCRWCHLLGDDLDELHRFAADLGIQRTSFQCAPKAATPHYDLTAYERVRAIRLGAVICSREEIVAVSRRSRATFKAGDYCGAAAPARLTDNFQRTTSRSLRAPAAA